MINLLILLETNNIGRVIAMQTSEFVNISGAIVLQVEQNSIPALETKTAYDATKPQLMIDISTKNLWYEMRNSVNLLEEMQSQKNLILENRNTFANLSDLVKTLVVDNLNMQLELQQLTGMVRRLPNNE